MSKPLKMFICALTLLIALPAVAAERFTLVEHPVNEITRHLGGKKEADSVGDTLTFANALFDAANKTQVASDQGFCTRTIVGKTWECLWTNVLKDGMITVQGPFKDTGDSVFVVTGGTGKYVGAKGQMTLHVREGKPEAYDFIFDLQ
jgi:hypothetical protein